MSEVIKVGIADLKLCKTPDKITTIGLGSCVGIVLYSKTSPWCGLVHIMLPYSKEIKNNLNPAKFADTGIVKLISALEEKGVKKESLLAKIAGGAVMFQFSGSTDVGSVGRRNVQAVKEILAEHRISIVAEDTGEDHGRTILFDNETKNLEVHSVGKGDKII